MSVTYLGGVTVAGTIPPLSATLVQVAAALEGLSAAVAIGRDKLADIEASLMAQADAIGVARLAIRIPAIADFEAQIAANLDLVAGLTVSITDPTVYIAGLLEGIAQCAANISALVPPQIAIDGQLSAAAAVTASLGIKIGAVDLELSALIAISLAIQALAALVLEISAALSVALAGIAGALQAYLQMDTVLGAAGVYLLHANSTVATIGAELNAALPSSGLAGSVAIQGPIIVVQSSDPSAVAAINSVFRTS